MTQGRLTMVGFKTLWANHPSNETPPNDSPCSTSGSPNFENQCAIRLGVTLARSGVSLSGYTGSFCWHKHGKEHPLRVNDMHKWLTKSLIFGKPDIAKQSKAYPVTNRNYLGVTGIVMWVNFWGTNNQGDHIDLWDGANIAHGSPDYFSRSQEIHFWQIP